MVQTTTDHHMKKTISLKFILSLAILTCVLIGDHSAQNSYAQTQPVPPPGTTLVSPSADNGPTTGTLPPDIDPNSALAQVIRLLQAGVEQSVILTYISNSASLFNLNADDIIYLNDLGAPAEIANAMMQRDQQLQQIGVAVGAQTTPPAETTETTATQPAEVTVNYFYDTLAPYGAWVDIEGYGWCWRPTIVIYDAGWQPYCNNGHWVYSDHGWYWVSGYSWGWAAFHYGRWFHNPRYGWCWWPDTTWAPSWVCWRYNQDYCGWAPLPPHAVYQSGVGFFYDGHKVSAGFTFGLSAGAFTFVATRDFCDLQPWRHRLGDKDVAHIYDHTTFIYDFDFDRHDQTIVNSGIPPHDITAVTRQEIHPVTIQAGNGSVAWGGRHEQFEHNGNTLIVNRPHFVGSPVLSPHAGNPAPNNPPRQDINPNLHPNFNRTLPRMPQTQQLGVLHTNPSNPQAPNNAVTTPPRNYSTWPAQNQKPNYNYNNSGNRILTPRALGAQQQLPHGTTYNSQSRGNTMGQQPFFNSSTANYHTPPANESQYNNQNFNRSESSQQVVQPHESSRSSSSSSQSSGNQGQNKGNNQNGH
jgi:hypothetical protein